MEFVDRELWLKFPAQTGEQRLFLTRLEQAGKPRLVSLRFRKQSGESCEHAVRFSLTVEAEFLKEANVGVRMERTADTPGESPGDDDPWKPLQDYLTECEARAGGLVSQAGPAPGG